MAARCILALGEAGNFPAAIKVTAEYFPKKDRAYATSIFNAGASIGAVSYTHLDVYKRQVKPPPMIGAATGATPLIAPMISSVFANALPVNISVATEREITILPAPAIPCSKRSIANISIAGA